MHQTSLLFENVAFRHNTKIRNIHIFNFFKHYILDINNCDSLANVFFFSCVLTAGKECCTWGENESVINRRIMDV